MASPGTTRSSHLPHAFTRADSLLVSPSPSLEPGWWCNSKMLRERKLKPVNSKIHPGEMVGQMISRAPVLCQVMTVSHSHPQQVAGHRFIVAALCLYRHASLANHHWSVQGKGGPPPFSVGCAQLAALFSAPANSVHVVHFPGKAINYEKEHTFLKYLINKYFSFIYPTWPKCTGDCDS